MTTTVTTAYSTAIANGTAPIPFEFQATGADEIGVLVDGVEQPSSSFTVELNGDDTGAVTPLVSWNASSIVIYSKPSLAQPAQFTRFGAFYPDQLEPPFDRLARSIIAIRSMLDRAMLVGYGDPPLALLPTADDRKGKFLVFDATTGDPAVGDALSAAEAATLASAAENAADEAAASLAAMQAALAGGALGNADAVETLHGSLFGLVSGDDPTHGAANSAVIAAMKAQAASTGIFHIVIPAGKVYWFNAPIDLAEGNYILEGSSGGGHSLTPSVKAILKFPAGVTGIRVQGDLTSGASTKDGVAHADARGTVIRNVALYGSYISTEAEAHGIQLRTMATIENCTIENFEGDGIHIAADLGAASGADPPYGNANNCFINGVSIINCRDGIYTAGGDANAATVIRPICFANRRWGINDTSGFSNTFIGGAMTANGITAKNDGIVLGASEVSYLGNIYGAIVGQEAWCSTHSPSGTTADNQGWYYLFAGAPGTGRPAWTNGMAVRAAGAVRHSALTSTSHFVGVYAEADQGKAQIFEPAMVTGGLLAGWCLDVAGVGGVSTPRIRGGLDITNVGASLLMGPLVGVSSGSVTVEIGGPIGNTLNRFLQFNHPTPGRMQLEFSAGLGNVIFCRGDGTAVVYQITTVSTTSQFGTGAAVTDAFNPPCLIVTDNARSLTNGRRLMVDTAIPASGAHGQGEFVHYRGSTAGLLGFICRTAGTPGTWDTLYAMTAAPQAPYTAWTGTANRATKDTATATLVDVAQTLKALIDDLKARAVI